MSDQTDVSRLTVALALILLLTSCSRGPLAFDELGESCRRGDLSDRFNSAYYFGQVSHVELVPAEAVKGIVKEAIRDIIDDDVFDVSALLAAADGRSVYDDGRITGATTLLLDGPVAGEASRLPDGLDAFVAIEPAYREGRGFVVFIAVVNDAGDASFVGKCGYRHYGNPLTEYRDTVRPYMDLVDVFLEVVTDESVWADFNDFDLREGKYESRS